MLRTGHCTPHVAYVCCIHHVAHCRCPRYHVLPQGMTAVQAAVGVVNQGLRPDIPQDTPPELASLIRACWAPVPDQRPTFDSVVQVLVGMLGPEFVGQDGKDSQAVECPPDRKSAPGRVGGGSAQQRA